MATCPSDNLYRIIGVFGSEVKLIKATSYGSYKWNSSENNTWRTSSIRTTLNSTYLSSLSATWQNKIENHSWKVGGTVDDNLSNSKIFYNYEVGAFSSNMSIGMKIGLMYVSDYGFAASNSYWTTALGSYYSSKSSNWLYLGTEEWTISRNSNSSQLAFYINGGVLFYSVTGSRAIRPCFYLTSSTTYVSGSGSSADPIRIS